jgi:uncharacterized membrane protein YsdA (DUF1294 family)
MNNSIVLYSLFGINILAYIFMCIDKFYAVYGYWRIREKTLWTFSIVGGVFGIWLGMQAPIYHKAGKRVFRIWVPILCLIWSLVMISLIWI